MSPPLFVRDKVINQAVSISENLDACSEKQIKALADAVRKLIVVSD